MDGRDLYADELMVASDGGGNVFPLRAQIQSAKFIRGKAHRFGRPFPLALLK
jgi:hypothetical protein